MTTPSCRQFGYIPDDAWAKLPAGWSFVEATAVAADRYGRVFVFNRGVHPMIVFDRSGNFLTSWGEGVFQRPHGVTIGPDDMVYCTDDFGHCVRKCTPEGRLLLTLGTPRLPSETGATSLDFRTIQRSAGPFHYPTNVALSAEGDIFVSDGYGNARIHRFSPDGNLLFSWGEAGSGPGQFQIPHGIAVDSHGTVFVADRENSRLQLFTPEGKYIDEWPTARPCQVFIDATDTVYVAELGYRAGMWPGIDPPLKNPTGGRVSIFDRHGTLQAQWGGGENPCSPGDFFAPHDIWVDSHGDIYVAEVTMSAGGNKGIVPPDCHSLQKFTKQK